MRCQKVFAEYPIQTPLRSGVSPHHSLRPRDLPGRHNLGYSLRRVAKFFPLLHSIIRDDEKCIVEESHHRDGDLIQSAGSELLDMLRSLDASSASRSVAPHNDVYVSILSGELIILWLQECLHIDGLHNWCWSPQEMSTMSTSQFMQPSDEDAAPKADRFTRARGSARGS
jgi:hypothetical protein